MKVIRDQHLKLFFSLSDCIGSFDYGTIEPKIIFYSKHIVQSSCKRVFLVSVYNNKFFHIPLKYRYPVQKSSNRTRPTYLTTILPLIVSSL